jgi:MFS family permease
MNTISTYNTYLMANQLSTYSKSSVGWIFSTYIFLTFFASVQIGPIFDVKGPRILVFVGSVMMITSVMLLGVCTSTEQQSTDLWKTYLLSAGYWHFLIVFGIIGGIGTSLIVTPAVAAIGHFFLTKRANATGIATVGGSFGGIIFPLMLEALFPRLGWAWSTRIQGFVFLFLLVLANLLIRGRLRPLTKSKLLPDMAIFRRTDFVLVTIAAFFLEWGLFVPVTYLSSYCLDSGVMSKSFALQIIAIYNAASSVGRWASGYVADRAGSYNVMIVTVFLCMASSAGLWLPAAIMSQQHVGPTVSYALTVSYTVLMGIASGSNISLAPVCIGSLCDTREYGQYYAMCYTIVAFGTLTGVPIAGAIIEKNGGAYWGVVTFTALCYLCALICFMAVRVGKAGWRWKAQY